MQTPSLELAYNSVGLLWIVCICGYVKYAWNYNRELVVISELIRPRFGKSFKAYRMFLLYFSASIIMKSCGFINKLCVLPNSCNLCKFKDRERCDQKNGHCTQLGERGRLIELYTAVYLKYKNHRVSVVLGF